MKSQKGEERTIGFCFYRMMIAEYKVSATCKGSPYVNKFLSVFDVMNFKKYEIQIPGSLKDEFENLQSQGQSDYTGLIKNLSQSGKQAGKIWLSAIAGVVRNVYTAGMKKS